MNEVDGTALLEPQLGGNEPPDFFDEGGGDGADGWDDDDDENFDGFLSRLKRLSEKIRRSRLRMIGRLDGLHAVFDSRIQSLIVDLDNEWLELGVRLVKMRR